MQASLFLNLAFSKEDTRYEMQKFLLRENFPMKKLQKNFT